MGILKSLKLDFYHFVNMAWTYARGFCARNCAHALKMSTN
eukprot:UN13233